MVVKKYQLIKFKAFTSINRICNKIKEIDNVFNAKIDKQTRTLIVEVNNPDKEYKEEAYFKKLQNNLLKAIHVYDKQASIQVFEKTEVYRKVLYLHGLDCAYCATRIENLAKANFKHERIVVDYPTYRFIIETTDKDLIDHIIDRVSELCHRIDERIVVEIPEKGKPLKEDLKNSINVTSLVIMCIGLFFYLWGVCYCFKSFDDYIFNRYQFDVLGFTLIILGYVLIGHTVFIRFFKNIFRKNIFDENFLMTIASIGALVTRNFSEAALVILLFLLGEFLQNFAIKRSRKSLEDLLSFEVTTVKLKLEDKVEEVAVESILPDDVIIVPKGEMIPIDGMVSTGTTTLDLKNITGESLAKVVSVGDEVLSGSINMGSMIELRAMRTYNNSTMTRLIDLVENATTNKAKMESGISRLSKYYTPLVVFTGLLIMIIGIVSSFFVEGYDYTDAIYLAMKFLVIACPCALVISIPLTFFSSIGVASKRGILIKGSNYLESMYNVETILFDKTGTLTKGEFKIIKTEAKEGYTEDDIKRLLAYTEYYSEHPIASSIVDLYGRDAIIPDIISDFMPLKGGAKASINGTEIIVGNISMVERLDLKVPTIYSPNIIVYVFKNEQYIGHVVIGDSIRDNAKELIENLHKTNIENVCMMTGDNERIARNVAGQIGISNIYYNLLPEDKVNLLVEQREKLKRSNGTIVYVGDGINDAPVIANADVGIAIGDTANEATMAIADVVIMTNDLNKLIELRKIAVATRRKVNENLIFCLCIKFIIIFMSVAFTGTNFEVPLALAVFSDVGVSMLCILNALSIFLLFGKLNKIIIGESHGIRRNRKNR